MKEYLAHYSEDGTNQLLQSHISGVANRAREAGDMIGIGNTAYLVGLLHDLGKVSDSFQSYLRKEEGSAGKGEVNHTSAGAEVLWNLFGKSIAGQDMRLLAELLCYAISAHHGLYDIITMEDVDKFEERLMHIKAPELSEEFARWSADTGISNQKLVGLMKEVCKEFQERFLKTFLKIKQQNSNEYLFYAGCFERLLLSIQIDSDWTDTAEAMNPQNRVESPKGSDVFPYAWQNYQAYMKQLQKKSEKNTLTEKEKAINSVRNQIQTECLEFTKNGAGIYCLPIPTGAGKTLTSLGYALKYANEHLELEEVERIFYISPYISVTEQNAHVIKEAVGNPDWVLEHHSNVINSDEKEGDCDTSWEDRIICTTMVQFLNTLFSDRKKSIRRFHKLKKSIVILDEVQSLPIKTIHTFNLMMNFLHQVCEANIILCTATQPNLDSKYVRRKIWYSEQRNMISELSKRYEQFERVKIVSHISAEKETMENFGRQIAKTLTEKNSVLVIFNKRQPVADFYDYIKELLEDVDIYYLTTNLCAEHRSRKIVEIKRKLREKKRKILIVSTNLIEAGVDLSVECVYRSLAGIDSIAQAAGRCNRNGEIDQGIVYVFELEGDEPGKNMEELLAAQHETKEIIYRHEKMQANESLIFPKWMQEYYDGMYEKLHNKMDFSLQGEYRGNTIFGLLSKGFEETSPKHILKQAFKTAGERYQVISDTGFTVLVPYGEGKGLIGALEELSDMGSIRKCLRTLQRYTVSVYYNKKEELMEKGVLRECKVLPEVYIALGYDDEKGLKNVLLDAIF